MSIFKVDIILQENQESEKLLNFPDENAHFRGTKASNKFSILTLYLSRGHNLRLNI